MSGNPEDFLLKMYNHYWGVPLPQEHISLPDPAPPTSDEEHDEDNVEENILPAKPPPVIRIPWNIEEKLFIRAEYVKIYQWALDQAPVGPESRPSAIVITGQPGIGQSCHRYNNLSFF